jgi:uncharacterized protein YbjT (DUF2867 family)
MTWCPDESEVVSRSHILCQTLPHNSYIAPQSNGAQAFFGKSRARMTQEELDAVLGEDVQREQEIARLTADVRPSSILVAGATGETGRLVVLELQKKDFNVRVLTRNLKKAEQMFGRDGAEVDIVVCDLRNAKEVEEAAVGCQAGVFCAGSRLPWGPDSFQAVDGDGAVHFARAMQVQGCQKVVLISAMSAGDGSLKGSLKMLGDPLGAKARGEAAVRASGVPYVIVRPGGLRDKLGGIDGIEVGQGGNFDFLKSGVARYDLAEGSVAALVSDKENVTFEVRNIPLEETPAGAPKRPFLASFSEPDPFLVEEMRIEEAVKTELYWEQVLATLTPDSEATYFQNA